MLEFFVEVMGWVIIRFRTVNRKMIIQVIINLISKQHVFFIGKFHLLLNYYFSLWPGTEEGLLLNKGCQNLTTALTGRCKEITQCLLLPFYWVGIFFWCFVLSVWLWFGMVWFWLVHGFCSVLFPTSQLLFSCNRLSQI